MSLNKVMLIGNVGQDPEIKYLESSTKVATINIATTERYRDRNMELKEITTWHRIVAWRGLADLAEKYIKKGSQIYVGGKIQNRSYTDKSGNNRTISEILAEEIQLLGKKSDNQNNDYQKPNTTAPTQYNNVSNIKENMSSADANQNITNMADDDLPF